MDTLSSLLGRIRELKAPFLKSERVSPLSNFSAASTVVIGLLLLPGLFPSLANFSYDFPFMVQAMLPVFQRPVPTNEVVIVYMDDYSHKELKELGAPTNAAWNRKIHAQLIDVLRKAEARAIVFDVAFDRPSPEDSIFIQAAAAVPGRVFLGAYFVTREEANVEITGLFKPDPGFRPVTTSGPVEAAEADRVMRQHFRSNYKDETLAWKLSQALHPRANLEPFAPRWVNYYGPPLSLPHYSYVSVYRSDFAPGALSNKVVFIGALHQIGYTGGGGAGTDDFRTPYTAWSAHKRSPGVELLATTYLNLARGDWLREPGAFAQVLLVLLAGLVLGFGLMALRPVAAVGATAATVFVLGLIACVVAWGFQRWFPWAVVAFGQAPVALAWSLLVNVSQLRREKEMLEEKLATALGEKPTLLPMPERTKVLAPTTAAAAGAAAGPAAGAPLAPPIPNHELLRCIGKGAYGEVWLARDEIGSYHAVKVVHRSSFGDGGPFDREFRGIQQYTPISRTHHGLVHILHVGRNKDAGYFFYIMELGDCEVNGTTITPETYCAKNLGRELDRRGKLPVKECVHLAMELAEALHYLHSKQLIHRDIKPSNIIFVNSQPKFADVGLVTHVAERGRDVSFLGTEGFIAPEGPGTPSADVFSLGKVIYEACMGRSAAQYPELPTSLTKHEELDQLLALNEIILKACDPDVRRRYKTAVELQTDLMHLNDRLYGGAQRAHP